MPIHTNPFRLYSSRICVNHGLLVEILRSSQRFWVAYKHLLEINGKRESDVKDLKVLMEKMGLEPKKRSRIRKDASKDRVVHRRTKRMLHHLRHNVEDELRQGFHDIEEMFHSLDRILLDDETLLFRAFKEVRLLYLKVMVRYPKADHVSEHLTHSVLHSLHSLMHHMVEIQHHSWRVAKAHSRSFIRLDELTVQTNRAERRRIRQETIELDHLQQRIGPLRQKLMTIPRHPRQDITQSLQQESHELIENYKEEISNIKHILHESDVLIRRTEMLFRAIEKELEALGLHHLKGSMRDHARIFHRMHTKFESQARREYNHMSYMFRKTQAPPKTQPAH
ncbi:hypothetical protein KY362_04300 [Candidatus Woesearchaeota archaeon]|nr:hypothetical protein [Candidatus Woesearchaeota archaeon]